MFVQISGIGFRMHIINIWISYIDIRSSLSYAWNKLQIIEEYLWKFGIHIGIGRLDPQIPDMCVSLCLSLCLCLCP
jgi:hypothetical protein